MENAVGCSKRGVAEWHRIKKAYNPGAQYWGCFADTNSFNGVAVKKAGDDAYELSQISLYKK